jgi:hypothetical protein
MYTKEQLEQFHAEHQQFGKEQLQNANIEFLAKWIAKNPKHKNLILNAAALDRAQKEVNMSDIISFSNTTTGWQPAYGGVEGVDNTDVNDLGKSICDSVNEIVRKTTKDDVGYVLLQDVFAVLNGFKKCGNYPSPVKAKGTPTDCWI